MQRFDGGIQVAMLLLQLCQLQSEFVVVLLCHDFR